MNKLIYLGLFCLACFVGCEDEPTTPVTDRRPVDTSVNVGYCTGSQVVHTWGYGPITEYTCNWAIVRVKGVHSMTSTGPATICHGDLGKRFLKLGDGTFHEIIE